MLDRLFPDRAVRGTFLILIFAQLILVLCHVIAIVWDAASPSYNTTILRNFFELSREGNAPTWFSSLLFLLVGLVCGAIYCVEGYASNRPAIVEKTRSVWLLYAALFTFLSFDETSQLHERLDWMMSGLPEGGNVAEAVNDGTEELPFYRYLLIYFPVLGALGLAMAWFVIHRFQQLVSASLFFVGMGLLASKLLIESFEQWSLSMTWFGHSLYLETVIVEMSCLFTGATLIVTSLLNYLVNLVKHAFILREPASSIAARAPVEHPAPDPRVAK